MILLYTLFIHWVADFVFQDEKWAINKSKFWDALILHTSVYSIILYLAFVPILGFIPALYFAVINYLLHTIIDYFSSRVVAKRFYDKYLGGPIPNFGVFTIIGFDQFLHYCCLFTTLKLFL